MTFVNAHTTSNSHNTQCHQQTKNTQQGRAEDKEDYSQQGNKVINNDHRQETINAPEKNGTAQQRSKVIKTRYGQTVKKLDRLSYT